MTTTEQTIAEKYGFKTKIESDIQKRLFDTFKELWELKAMWRHTENAGNGVYARFYKNLYHAKKLEQQN